MALPPRKVSILGMIGKCCSFIFFALKFNLQIYLLQISKALIFCSENKALYSHILILQRFFCCEFFKESKARLVDIYSCRLNFDCPDHLQPQPIIPNNSPFQIVIRLHYQPNIKITFHHVLNWLCLTQLVDLFFGNRLVDL